MTVRIVVNGRELALDELGDIIISNDTVNQIVNKANNRYKKNQLPQFDNHKTLSSRNFAGVRTQ